MTEGVSPKRPGHVAFAEARIGGLGSGEDDCRAACNESQAYWRCSLAVILFGCWMSVARFRTGVRRADSPPMGIQVINRVPRVDISTTAAAQRCGSVRDGGANATPSAVRRCSRPRGTNRKVSGSASTQNSMDSACPLARRPLAMPGVSTSTARHALGQFCQLMKCEREGSPSRPRSVRSSSRTFVQRTLTDLTPRRSPREAVDFSTSPHLHHHDA